MKFHISLHITKLTTICYKCYLSSVQLTTHPNFLPLILSHSVLYVYQKVPCSLMQELQKRRMLSLDVVAIMSPGNSTYKLSENLLENAPEYDRSISYAVLETWHKKNRFQETSFVQEWDVLDSLPTDCRLAIVIAKALVQVSI